MDRDDPSTALPDAGSEVTEIATAAQPWEGLWDAAAAAGAAGDLVTALDLCAELRAHDHPDAAWAGLSCEVANARALRDWERADAVVAEASAADPTLVSLFQLWTAHTRELEGDLGSALVELESVLASHDTLVDGIPVHFWARRERARVLSAMGRHADAAAQWREIATRDADLVDPELAMLRAVVSDSQASGDLPIGSVGGLLHDGTCSADRRCAVGTGDGPARLLADQVGIEVRLSEADLALLERPREPELGHSLNRTACVLPPASSGMARPIAVDHHGYDFLDFPDSTGGYHPGDDLNGPGGCDADLGTDVLSPARGCVTDGTALPTTWGSGVVDTYYVPHTWSLQFGHMSTWLYSVAASVNKAAPLGDLDDVGTGCAHVHVEVREEDHTAVTDADDYTNAPIAVVADFYQDPLPFYDAHRSFAWVQWLDESAFVPAMGSTWTYDQMVGNEDNSATPVGDMKYAVTTATLVHSASKAFTPTATATHELWAFVPRLNATSSAAKYQITNSGGAVVFAGTIDQLPRLDAWVKVGSFSLTGGQSHTLRVSSDTGEVGRVVGLDDVLIIRP